MTIPNLTLEQRTAFAELLATKDQDMLKEMLSLVYDAGIRAQFDEHIGGARGISRSSEPARVLRPRVRLPFRRSLRSSDRSCGSAPTATSVRRLSIQFRCSERALVSVIQEAFIAGISTRKMEGVLAQMGVERLAKSQISALCTELDAKAEEFRHRALKEPYPYLWLDALYEKVRIDGAVVSNAVVIAYGVTARGFRDVIAIDVVDTESKESWTTFLRGLRKRARGAQGRDRCRHAGRELATLYRAFLP